MQNCSSDLFLRLRRVYDKLNYQSSGIFIVQ